MLLKNYDLLKKKLQRFFVWWWASRC